MDYNSFFQPLTNDQPFLKVGMQGFSGTGKTHLAVTIALGLHKKIKSKKPIIIYDTEKAFRAVKDRFESAGVEPQVKLSRTLTDLETALNAADAGYSDILVIDSITHVWESFVQGYLNAKTARMRRRNPKSPPVTRLSFPDWAYLKPEWKKRFSDRIVDGKAHIIFTGRAGYTYDHDEDTETGRMTELKKTGIKMKAESETAYEPDVLVLLERMEDLLGKEKKIWREATIIKDRYRIIDGKTFKNPTFKDFEGMIEKALDGTLKTRAEETPDDFSELEQTSDKWKKRRDIAIEEIESTMTQFGFSTSAAEKAIKIDLVEKVFGTSSWTAIQSMRVDDLEERLLLLKAIKSSYLEYCKEETDSGGKIDKNQVYLYADQVLEAKSDLSDIAKILN